VSLLEKCILAGVVGGDRFNDHVLALTDDFVAHSGTDQVLTKLCEVAHNIVVCVR